MYKLYYYDEVELDIKEARAWYRATNEKLESRFVQAVQDTILKLQAWPKAYSIRYKNIRIAHTPIFPFGIHFYIDELKLVIVIVAIIHGKRDPDLVKKRI